MVGVHSWFTAGEEEEEEAVEGSLNWERNSWSSRSARSSRVGFFPAFCDSVVLVVVVVVVVAEVVGVVGVVGVVSAGMVELDLVGPHGQGIALTGS